MPCVVQGRGRGSGRRSGCCDWPGWCDWTCSHCGYGCCWRRSARMTLRSSCGYGRSSSSWQGAGVSSSWPRGRPRPLPRPGHCPQLTPPPCSDRPATLGPSHTSRHLLRQCVAVCGCAPTPPSQTCPGETSPGRPSCCISGQRCTAPQSSQSDLL